MAKTGFNWDKLALILLVIVGLNAGLATFGWNVINMLLGGFAIVENLVYWLAGLSALWTLKSLKK